MNLQEKKQYSSSKSSRYVAPNAAGQYQPTYRNLLVSQVTSEKPLLRGLNRHRAARAPAFLVFYKFPNRDHGFLKNLAAARSGNAAFLQLRATRKFFRDATRPGHAGKNVFPAGQEFFQQCGITRLENPRLATRACAFLLAAVMALPAPQRRLAAHAVCCDTDRGPSRFHPIVSDDNH